jgi:hypothetical protein
MKMTNSMDKLAKLYVNEMVRLYGVPITIVLDKDSKFTSWLWPSIQNSFGMRLNLSTAFLHQIDG